VRTLLLVSIGLTLGGCGDGGCSTAPLAGPLPADQTIEGGGQVRVTPAGFTKLTSLIPAVINDLASDGFCIGEGQWGNPSGTCAIGTYYCNTEGGGACGADNGCDVDLHIDSTTLTVPDSGRLRVTVQLDVDSYVHLDYQGFCASDECDMHVVGNDIRVSADVIMGIDSATGELDVHALIDDDYDLSGVQFSDCGFLSTAGNFAVDFIESQFGRWLSEYLQPTLDDLIRGALPDPLGIEGVIEVGSLLGGVSPGTEAALEVRGVPGGYVQLRGNGASLGLIIGLNSDEDPATRTAALDSEPHYCVPPIPAPNFAAPPAGLSATSRGTFSLLPAEEFLGVPEPAADIVLGISETTLDLAGHHAVTSGMMCLGVGTSTIAQLNLGTFGLLVPSLSSLGDPEDPVLLVTRPQQALDLAIGANTTASPALTVTIDDFEVDVYVFVYERYTRAFTMKVDLTVGINLVFDQAAGQPATVTPELVGLDADEVEITVLNNEFVRETADELEDTLPTIFDLAVNLLGDALDPIEIPNVATFTLDNLSIKKVETAEDDFLALYASLGSSSQLRQLADRFPSITPILDGLAPGSAAPAAPRPVVSVRSVVVPAPAEVRAALAGAPDRSLPVVTLSVPARDAAGRTLEHAWRIHGGPWRPYRTGDQLVISDRVFAWQAAYTIDVRSRVVGDYTTTSATSSVDVTIDSVAPDVRGATLGDAGLTAGAHDLVSTSLAYAWGRPGSETPWTDWSTSPTLDRATLDDLVVDREVAVWVRDDSGNTAIARVPAGFHGQASDSGCGCSSGRRDSAAGSLLLLAFVVLPLARPAAARRPGALRARARVRIPDARRGPRGPRIAISHHPTLAVYPSPGRGTRALDAPVAVPDAGDGYTRRVP